MEYLLTLSQVIPAMHLKADAGVILAKAIRLVFNASHERALLPHGTVYNLVSRTQVQSFEI